VAYCLSIHLLNSFIGFISPLEDPEEDELNGDNSFLPTGYYIYYKLEMLMNSDHFKENLKNFIFGIIN